MEIMIDLWIHIFQPIPENILQVMAVEDEDGYYWIRTG